MSKIGAVEIITAGKCYIEGKTSQTGEAKKLEVSLQTFQDGIRKYETFGAERMNAFPAGCGAAAPKAPVCKGSCQPTGWLRDCLTAVLSNRHIGIGGESVHCVILRVLQRAANLSMV